ncbi:hypothetical protein [Paenibacillus apii]|nr:hypothetical protein [Paenibacillus apii]
MLEAHQDRVARQMERLEENMGKVKDKIKLYKQMEEESEAGGAE